MPPTDNLNFRKAVQAVLDMDEIMDAATDGNYSLNVGFQYPNQADYTDAGKETYNIKDPAKAKQYLAQSGYKGEPVVLLTNKDYHADVQLGAGDGRADEVDRHQRAAQGGGLADLGEHGAEAGHRLEFLLHRLGHPAVARRARHHPAHDRPESRATCRRTARTIPDLLGGMERHEQLRPIRRARQAAFARAQKIALEQVMEVPFGSLTKVQATRANVKGFVPVPHSAHVQRVVRQLAESQTWQHKHFAALLLSRLRLRRDAVPGRTVQMPARGRQLRVWPGGERQQPRPDDVGHDLHAQRRHEHLRNADDARRRATTPILELADSMTEAPDHLSYTFKLRQGVKFHNGKALTSADVLASFERYRKISLLRDALDAVASFETPDPQHVRHPHEAGAADLHPAAEFLQSADRRRSGRREGRSRRSSFAPSAPGRGNWTTSRRAHP